MIKIDLRFDVNNQSLQGQYINNRSITGWIIRIIFFYCTLFALFISSGFTVFHIHLSGQIRQRMKCLKPGINYKAKKQELQRQKMFLKNIHQILC